VSPYQSQGLPHSPMNQHAQGPNNSYQGQPNYSPQFQQQFSPGIPPASPYGRPSPQLRQVYNPGLSAPRGQDKSAAFDEARLSQSAHLEKLVQECAPAVGIDDKEEAEKEAFRAIVEQACREAISQYEKEELGNTEFDLSTVELICFGSMSSGFATKDSDMDLALVTPNSVPAADTAESAIPRILEKKLLDMGFGARLLTRTRVPIIKLCQKPSEKLLADLLQERAKWENGFVDEEKTPTEGKPISSKETLNETPNGEPPPSPEPSPTQMPLQKASLKEDELSKLKQKDDQTIGDYYNMAKRILRKLGGREVSVGSPNLTEDEGQIMNAVCRSFISGLKAQALIARLQSYQSISPLFNSSLPSIQRSLNGVFTQVEGERLAMAYNDRPLTERDDRREFECQKLVEGWQSLQDTSNLIYDPLPYNRHLYVASEKLKAISSLQLVFLEQLPLEDPIFYQKRTFKIIDDLRGYPKDGEEVDSVSPIVIAHYISGVTDPTIRECLSSSTQDRSSFSQIALQHRTLQLAADYEHALNKAYFEEMARPHVEKYVKLLRDRAINGPPTRADDDASLIAIMRTLPDPTTISLSKPRDRYKDHLEFPKTNIGIQCDINFSAHLGLHNTLLLRCYSHSDPRVKPLILFVKQWAKVRGVNSSYRGTLSSYGYVLMVLHYLVNIAQPFVCPNLQLINQNPPSYLSPSEIEARTYCRGRDVRFWRNETEIQNLSARGLLNHNHDSVGLLLRGFFEYYAQSGQMSTVSKCRGFDWGRDVLSLRTQGGILSKQEKGWVSAKTTFETSTIAAPPTPSTPAHPKDQDEGNAAKAPDVQAEVKSVKPKTIEETKEIRHRYLFAIEDPFEHDHNVARTVTHNGIVSIRDEFRRAWGIIRNLDKSYQNGDSLMAPVVATPTAGALNLLFDRLHGPEPKANTA
jgi:terminal uridylyltransferase